MSLYKSTDSSATAPTVPVASGLGISANGQALYANTTASAFVPNLEIGLFGISTDEITGITTGNVADVTVVSGGSSFTALPTVTITGDGTGATAYAKLFGGRVASIVMTNKGVNYTRATVSISGDTGTGVNVTPILQSRIGILRTYYLNNNGEKIFVSENAGTIDYDSGVIVLKSLLPVSITSNTYYETNVLTINTFVDREIITSIRNKILDIDVNNPLSSQIEVVSV